MPNAPAATDLSRRERQIMDVVYRLSKASVTDVLDRIPDPPSYSAVRALMRILEEKGHLKHEQEGPVISTFPRCLPTRRSCPRSTRPRTCTSP